MSFSFTRCFDVPSPDTRLDPSPEVRRRTEVAPAVAPTLAESVDFDMNAGAGFLRTSVGTSINASVPAVAGVEIATVAVENTTTQKRGNMLVLVTEIQISTRFQKHEPRCVSDAAMRAPSVNSSLPVANCCAASSSVNPNTRTYIC